MGILGRDDKPDLVYFRLVQHRLCNDQMTLMNGIKRTKKQAYLHYFVSLSNKACASFNTSPMGRDTKSPRMLGMMQKVQR